MPAFARPMLSLAALLPLSLSTACNPPASPAPAGQIAQGLHGDDEGLPPNLPADLAVGPGETLKFERDGVGVQIYTCTATGWVFKAPEADLLDDEGGFHGNHFLGPTWEYRDGSKVVGTVTGKVPSPDPKAIPWLRLHATATGLFPDRTLGDVTTILRLNTRGGIAPPAADCDAAEMGKDKRVDYTADYFFFHKDKDHDHDHDGH